MRLPATPFRRPAVVTSAIAIGLNALLLGQRTLGEGITRGIAPGAGRRDPRRSASAERGALRGVGGG